MVPSAQDPITHSLSRTAASLLLILTVLVVAASPCAAQDVRTDLYVASGPVYATAFSPSGDTLYIGGSFTQVGPATGGWVGTDPTTGQVQYPTAMMDGHVGAAASDGAGGWYIGGSFSRVKGVARTNLVHILADGSVSDWDPFANNSVSALVVSGSTVYVGGMFTSVGGQVRNRIAALDATTGAATPWDPNADDMVLTLAVSGSTVYAGGLFTTIGGQSRSRIAALDAATGLATAWNPNAVGGNVLTLVTDGSTVYAGGFFSTIGGTGGTYLAALSAATGQATSWGPNAGGPVYGLCLGGSTLYVGGDFSTIGGQSRHYVAAVSTTTGLATSWNPGADEFVNVLNVSGSTVYAGGGFRTIGGQSRTFAGALDAATGAATSWDPKANGEVCVVVPGASAVFIGGDLSSVGGVDRSRIAALDTGTGAVTPWNPGADGAVRALAVSGATVYAGGDFLNIGGAARTRLAALDAATGAATAWSPTASSTVYELAVNATTVYAGGAFTLINGVTRNRIAALSPSTGSVQMWNPDANDVVRAIVVDGTTVYVGGAFTTIGGLTRNRVAAMTTSWSVPTAWDPNADAAVYDLAVSGSSVYAGGSFTTIGGQARNRIAALDVATGAATAWDPNAGSTVYALAPEAAAIYAGGSFSTIGGQTRYRIAALDAVTGAATGWTSRSGNTVRTLALGGDVLYAGGDFGSMGGLPMSYVAGIGTGVPACELSADSLDFASIPVGESADESFVIRNSGGGQLAGAVSEACGHFEIVSGAGAFSLAAGESLTVTVRFAPLTQGAHECAVETGTELCGAVVCTGEGSGGAFWIEPFDYADGDLTIESGLVWTTHNGTGTDIQVVDGKAVGDMASAPDDNRPFPAPQGGTDKTYASFKVMIPSIAGVPGTNYFAHYRVGTTFRSKVWVTASASTFTFGVSVGGNSLVPPAGNTWPVALEYDEWYTVAILYDAALGVSKLWVNPMSEGSSSITATDYAMTGTLIDGFALRQSNTASELWQFEVDDIAVGETFADVIPVVVGVAEEEAPKVFRMLAAQPNPFSRSTRLSYELPERARVELRIFDVSGRMVRGFVEGERESGRYAVEWDGRDARGRGAPPGVYFAEIRAGAKRETQRIVFLR